MRRVAVALALLAVTVALPAAAADDQSGVIVAVDPSAQLITAGAARKAGIGDAVPTGSVIQTGPTGRVQAQFPDGTKIVVGPNSTMTIDDTLFAPSGVAQSFQVSAIGGAFRFITGASPKKVYKVSTPLATMGVRGTAFDFAVSGGAATHLLVYEGSVKFCAQSDRCAIVPGGCHAVSVDRRQDFSQPASVDEKRKLLGSVFPLEAAQQRLNPAFRTDVGGCDSAAMIALPPTASEAAKDADRPDHGGSSAGGRSGNPAE